MRQLLTCLKISLGVGILVVSWLEVSAQDVTKIIAKVNGQIITTKDIDDYCTALSLRLTDENTSSDCSNPDFKATALEKLIEDKLVLNEAKKAAIDIPLPAISARLEKMILAYPTREEFDASLVERGLTITSLKEIIKEKYLMQVIIEQYVRSQVTIPPQEISTYYVEHQNEFHAPRRYVFYVAQADDYITVKELSMLIDAEGMEAAQKEHADAFVVIESAPEELRPELSSVIGGLTPQAHAIKKIDEAYYLFFLDEIREPRQLSMAEVKENIHEYLRNEKFKIHFTEWIAELKKKAVIEIF